MQIMKAGDKVRIKFSYRRLYVIKEINHRNEALCEFLDDNGRLLECYLNIEKLEPATMYVLKQDPEQEMIN